MITDVVGGGGGDTPKLLWCNVKTRNPGMNLVLPQINFRGSRA
jgi:hypothetical protein